MLRIKKLFNRRKGLILFLFGTVLTILCIYPFNQAVRYTSSNQYCSSCHVHDHAEESWRLSPHVNNQAGIVVNCVDCHLPPKGQGHLAAKVKHGAKDVYGKLFKDSADFNWESKRNPEKANHFVYEASCKKCHANLYPATLSVDGADSHLHYERSADEMTCLNCHMHTGHFNPDYQHAKNLAFGAVAVQKELFTEPAKVDKFEDFTETIPGSPVAFRMKAIPGGEFTIGSPDSESYRKKDEGPQKQVNISPFFMAEVEVSWDEFLAWFNATASEGRKEADTNVSEEVDAISGATPPWGAPDQGWGKEKRPAITMSYHAATQYCKWLTHITGRTYRLPTEAEWEYAARGGTDSPYFFPGSPKKFSSLSTWNKWFGADTATINTFAIYKENSEEKTQEPGKVAANPFGLKNMVGNVAEFCLDWYAPNAYAGYEDGITDPKGPQTGKEHVVRGGSFRSDASDLRSAARNYTQSTEWLKTDPQIPKSIWWYSDAVHVGFRVVCEADFLEKAPENNTESDN